MLEGQTKVIQRGVQGLRTIVYKETYKCGNKVERKKVKTETVYKPSLEVVNVSTRKVLQMKVTARALVGPKNSIVGEARTLDGFPSL